MWRKEAFWAHVETLTYEDSTKRFLDIDIIFLWTSDCQVEHEEHEGTHHQSMKRGYGHSDNFETVEHADLRDVADNRVEVGDVFILLLQRQH